MNRIAIERCDIYRWLTMRAFALPSAPMPSSTTKFLWCMGISMAHHVPSPVARRHRWSSTPRKSTGLINDGEAKPGDLLSFPCSNIIFHNYRWNMHALDSSTHSARLNYMYLGVHCAAFTVISLARTGECRVDTWHTIESTHFIIDDV